MPVIVLSGGASAGYHGGMEAEWVIHLRREVQAYVERTGIASVMNDTKWRELCSTFQDGGLRFRIKDILADMPSDWDGEWYYHPLPYFTIEWMDIAAGMERRVVSKGTPTKYLHSGDNRADEIASSLRLLNVPFSRDGNCVRVWGYLRPGEKPKFDGHP